MSARHRKPKRRRQRKRFRLIRSVGTRLTDSVGAVRQAIAEPRSVPRTMRDAFLRLWRTRGGGFYGLGYVIAFVVLEIQAFIGNWQSAATDVVGMVVQEVLQFVFRFAAQSMLNGLLAFGWPIYVVDKLGGWGLALIAVGWWSFDRYVRPWVAVRLPEPSEPKATEVSRAADPPTPIAADADDTTLNRIDAARPHAGAAAQKDPVDR